VTRNNDIKANLYNTYEALLKNGIVIADEITMLEAWLKDL